MLLKLEKYKNKDHPLPHHRKTKVKKKLISSYTESTGLFYLFDFIWVGFDAGSHTCGHLSHS